jgi:hypothetical protein
MAGKASEFGLEWRNLGSMTCPPIGNPAKAQIPTMMTNGNSPKRVSDTGARSGCILRGVVPHNEGIRLRIMQDQSKGTTGPIQGRFEILDVGNNKHANSLLELVGRTTDAEAVLTILRRTYASCVSVVNANILTVEEE